jgi:hypothetical protein
MPRPSVRLMTAPEGRVWDFSRFMPSQVKVAVALLAPVVWVRLRTALVWALAGFPQVPMSRMAVACGEDAGRTCLPSSNRLELAVLGDLAGVVLSWRSGEVSG